MKVLLVDDHAIVRAGLRRLFAALPDVQIIEAATGREALALVRAERPALILLDLNLPGLGGLELLRRVLLEHPEARVVVLSMHAETLYATQGPARRGRRLPQQERITRGAARSGAAGY